MLKIGLFVIIFSTIVLLSSCVAWGFYDQIMKTGFNPTPILFAVTVLSVMLAIVGIMMCCGLFVEDEVEDEREEF